MRFPSTWLAVVRLLAPDGHADLIDPFGTVGRDVTHPPRERRSMNDIRSGGHELFQDMIPGVLPDDPTDLRDGGFAEELTELALEHVFAALWGRPGLDRRSRSLVTLGALIALRAPDELEFHFPMALRNGLTVDELEEVVYHLAGYAGYPAAVGARAVARKVLESQASPSTSQAKRTGADEHG